MKKRLASGYTFDASAQTVLHADFSDITLEGIQLIVNVTDQIIIYNFADTAKGGTLSTDTLTLEYDTTSMDDADDLMILVEDGSPTQPVSGTVTANAGTNLNTSALALETGGNLATIAGDTTSIDGKITACNTGAVVVASGAITIQEPLSVDDNGSTISVDDGASSLTVDGTVAVTQSGTWDEVGINDSGNSITVDGTVTANLSATDNAVLDQIELNTDPLLVVGTGTEATAQRVTIATDSTGVLSVDDNGGALTVDGTVTANLSATDNAVLDDIAADTESIKGYTDGIETVLGTIDTDTGNIATSTGVMDDWDNAASDGASVSGDVAHDSADAGEPVKCGAKAETSPKGITLVADGDRTNLHADADGLLMVKVNTSGADLISERVADTGGTSTAFTNFSAVAATYNYVTAISIYNSSATAGYVDFRDGAAGSVLWTMAAPAGGGSVLAGATPLLKTSANTALAYDVSGALSTVYISISGFQSKV